MSKEKLNTDPKQNTRKTYYLNTVRGRCQPK